MNISKEFQELVQSDIKRIENETTSNTSKNALLKLHKEIDCRYQSCIANWYQGLNAIMYLQSGQPYLEYGYLDYPEEIAENLNMWKAKLEVYVYGMNAIAIPKTPTTNVNVTTNVNLNITFEQVRTKIEHMTSLTDEQTKEALDKIFEIESVVKGDGSKKSKWEKIKPVLMWLADKSFDVAMTILPLLLQVQG